MSGIPNKTTLSFVVLLCLILPVRSQTKVGQITGQVADSSGAPIAACTVAQDTAVIGVATTRADLVGNPELPKGDRTLTRWFKTAAFAIPPSGRFGTSGRNILIGPGFNQWGLSLLKNFSSQNFGQITGSGPGRVFEFGLRLAF